MRTLAEWLTLQESVHPRSIDLGLARVSAVAHTLGVAQPQFPVITVAGTNGKGSVVAHIEALLRARGALTGMFTSPHLIRYNERIRVGGTEVSDGELLEVFARIEAARGATTLTFFEYNTLAALCIFIARAVDTAVLEVGLGGRLDATNLVAADVAVIASIGFDHRDWLGDTLELIGAEKAGILRPGKPAVLGTPHMPASVYAAARACGTQLLVAERDFRWSTGAERWDYQGLAVSLHDCFQERRWLSAKYEATPAGARAFESLGIDLAAIRALRRPFARACLDWSERRPHLGGALGAALLKIALRKRWVEQDLDSRALSVTSLGRRELSARFGITSSMSGQPWAGKGRARSSE